MRENEAPEKLYTDSNGNNPMLKCYLDSDVEYTRTDSFIEKACKFLYKYNKKQVQKPSPKATLGYSGHTINVDEFRKYMKGEIICG